MFQRLWPQWQYTLLSRILFQTTEEQERTLASEACSIHQRGSLDEAESCKKSKSLEKQEDDEGRFKCAEQGSKGTVLERERMEGPRQQQQTVNSVITRKEVKGAFSSHHSDTLHFVQCFLKGNRMICFLLR